jgi:cell division protein FtsW (lipid II flippase)
VFGLGIISSTLAENKLFAVSIVIMTLATMAIYLLRGERLRRMWSLFFTSMVVFIGFISLYNLYAAEIGGAARIETYYLNPQALDNYLNLRVRGSSGDYNLGRNFALMYGWDTIKHDPVTMLFGLGMGSRSESSSLGVVGQGLSSSYYGLSTGSSLTVFLQEFGIVGLSLGMILVLWLTFRLYRDAARHPQSELNTLRYGLLLFSLFWPVWLWYASVWVMRAPMLLYWMLLGYIFNREIAAYFDKQQPEKTEPASARYSKITTVEPESEPFA